MAWETISLSYIVIAISLSLSICHRFYCLFSSLLFVAVSRRHFSSSFLVIIFRHHFCRHCSSPFLMPIFSLYCLCRYFFVALCLSLLIFQSLGLLPFVIFGFQFILVIAFYCVKFQAFQLLAVFHIFSLGIPIQHRLFVIRCLLSYFSCSLFLTFVSCFVMIAP